MATVERNFAKCHERSLFLPTPGQKRPGHLYRRGSPGLRSSTKVVVLQVKDQDSPRLEFFLTIVISKLQWVERQPYTVGEFECLDVSLELYHEFSVRTLFCLNLLTSVACANAAGECVCFGIEPSSDRVLPLCAAPAVIWQPAERLLQFNLFELRKLE